VALWGTTLALEINGDSGEITEHTWTAADFGLSSCEAEALTVDSPEESAAMIRGVLQGQRGAARDVVVANTAAALLAFEQGRGLSEAAERAANAIDDGAAAAKLASLVEVSGRLAH